MSKSKSSLSIVAASAIALLTHAGPAFADAKAADPARGPFLVGGSFGLGDIDCEDCETGLDAFGAAVHAGGIVGPRLAVVGEVWAMRHSETDDTLDAKLSLTHTIVSANAQYWLMPRLWVRGGIGFGRASAKVEVSDFEDEASANGVAVAVAAGYEVVVSPRFAVDVQIRFGTGAYQTNDEEPVDVDATNFAIGAGISWF